MNFQQYQNKFFNKELVEAEIKIASAIKFSICNDRLQWSIDFSKMPKDYRNVDKIASMKRGLVIGAYCDGNMYSNGIKLFKPNNLSFEALEQMKLSLTLEDYAQPFHTIVIELPENYISKRIIKIPETINIPCFVSLTHEKELNLLFICTYFDNGNTSTQVIRYQEGMTIEEALTPDQCNKGINSTYNREILDEDIIGVLPIVKATINACLILDETGVKKVNKNKNRVQKFHPIVYTFAQETKLFDIESNSENNTDKIMPTHWRHGYWVMQPYGPKSSRIRRPPVLVNGFAINQKQK